MGVIGPVQFVIQHTNFNDILESFMYKYKLFWPEWLVGRSSTHWSAARVAISHGNLVGLKILLDWVINQQNIPLSR